MKPYFDKHILACGLISLFFLTVQFVMPQAATGTAVHYFDFSEPLLQKVERKYGREAVIRLQKLAQLIQNKAGSPELDKVQDVNNFFNKITYYRDIVHWHMQDYWATPFEKLNTNGGDCEDYAIAKYFTLRELGVDDNKLRIMYVHALNWGEPHMVLTYFPHPDDIPLVLDNLNPKILPANQRKDLVPVFSFNAENLWVAKARGTGKQAGNSDRLKVWQELQERMHDF